MGEDAVVRVVAKAAAAIERQAALLFNLDAPRLRIEEFEVRMSRRSP